MNVPYQCLDTTGSHHLHSRQTYCCFGKTAPCRRCRQQVISKQKWTTCTCNWATSRVVTQILQTLVSAPLTVPGLSHRQALSLISLTYAAILNPQFSQHCRSLSSAFIVIDSVSPVTSTPKSRKTSFHFLPFCASSSLSFHIPLSFSAVILRPHVIPSPLLLCPHLTTVYFTLCSVIHTLFLFRLLFTQHSQHLISLHCLLCPILALISFQYVLSGSFLIKSLLFFSLNFPRFSFYQFNFISISLPLIP